MTNCIHNFEINHLVNGYDGEYFKPTPQELTETEVVAMINSAGACARVYELHINYRKGTSNEQLMIDYEWLPVYGCG